MEQHLIPLPGMWADHHVLVVRDTLTAVDGVVDVEASARERRVRVSYDPATTGPEAIASALTAAGYSPGEASPGEDPPTDKPAWASGGSRTTTTDTADLTMSGDYRKY
jgi:copper chaperone CopZ